VQTELELMAKDEELLLGTMLDEEGSFSELLLPTEDKRISFSELEDESSRLEDKGSELDGKLSMLEELDVFEKNSSSGGNFKSG
jgi:hypothetical protein